MSDNYNEPEDLLMDESFLAWYFGTPGAEPQKWERWISGHPDHARLVRQAVNLLDTTRIREHPLPLPQIAAAEASLLSRIDQLPTPIEITAGQAATNRSALPLFSRRRWMVAAAIFVVLSAGLIVTAVRSSRGTAIKTAFGELTSRQLPDGTEVMMDANSRISYAGNWKEGADREVWMNGEAFFHVRRTEQRSRFIVHLDHVDVIVTGTKFNIINRHGIENIMLEEGRVILREKNGKELVMSPGDFVSFREEAYEKKVVQKDSLMAWKEQKLVLDGTPLRELVTIINDHYGVHVQLADTATGNQTVSAILPNNNLEVLLQALEATAEFDISRDGDQITIRGRAGRN